MSEAHTPDQQPQQPPQLPAVFDEAGESPKWLPWLGLGLFCLAGLLIAGRMAATAH